MPWEFQKPSFLLGYLIQNFFCLIPKKVVGLFICFVKKIKCVFSLLGSLSLLYFSSYRDEGDFLLEKSVTVSFVYLFIVQHYFLFFVSLQMKI